MCQLGWPVVPTCIVKHQSECCYGDLFSVISIWIRSLGLKQITLHKVGRLQPINWPLQQRQFLKDEDSNMETWPELPPCCLQYLDLAACPTDLGFVSHPNCVSQFLKNKSLFLSMHLSVIYPSNYLSTYIYLYINGRQLVNETRLKLILINW